MSVTADSPVYFGSEVNMTCTASGDDIYFIEWSKRSNGSSAPFSPLSAGGRFDIVNVENSATDWDSTLTIKQFVEVDDGEYACQVNSDTARDVTVVIGSKCPFPKYWKVL